MNEVQKARLTLAIDELDKMIKGLSRDLSNMRSDHLAAWHMYGSKLCAGGMEKEECDLRDQISQLERKLHILRVYKDTEFKAIKQLREVAEDEIRQIEQRLIELEIARKSTQERLKELDLVLSSMGE